MTKRTVLSFPGDPDLELRDQQPWDAGSKAASKVRPRKEKIPSQAEPPTGKRPSGFVASDVMGAHHHENQSALKRPWQRTLGAYEIREGGIYLRKFNVRLATFSANSALLRDALAQAFNAAHAQIESERDELTKLPKLRKPKSSAQGTRK